MPKRKTNEVGTDNGENENNENSNNSNNSNTNNNTNNSNTNNNTNGNSNTNNNTNGNSNTNNNGNGNGNEEPDPQNVPKAKSKKGKAKSPSNNNQEAQTKPAKGKGRSGKKAKANTGNANYNGNANINMSDIRPRLTRDERLTREKACERLKEAHGEIYVPRDSKFGMLGDPEGEEYDNCDPLEQVMEDQDKTFDKLGIMYKGIHNKYICQHPKIGGHWYTDPMDKENGIDACLVRPEDLDCMSGKANSRQCTKIGEYPDLFGRLAGRMVSKDKELIIRQMLKGRLPVEWPTAYNNATMPINRAVKLFFNDRLSTPPMNANGPYEGPPTKEAKTKSCAARETEDLRAMRAGKHQAVIYTVMQALARPTNTGNTPRGILAWHSTGSGKTAVAAGVAEAFWHTTCPSDPKKKRPIIFLCSVDGLKSNPPQNFAKEARRFFKQDWKEQWLHAKEQGTEKCVEAKQAEKMGIKMSASTPANSDKNRMFLMTFAEFANRMDLLNRMGVKPGAPQNSLIEHEFAKDAILIIDEVHNLFKPLPGQGPHNTSVRKWLLSQDHKEDQGDMKIVIMTATPGDTIPQMEALLQIVQNQDQPRITVPPLADVQKFVEFGNSIRGLVSYLDLSNDTSKFPRIESEKVIECPISKEYVEDYIKVYETFADSVHKLNKWIYTRIKEDDNMKKVMRPFRDAAEFAEKVVISGNGETRDEEKKKKDGNSVNNNDDIDIQAAGWFNAKENTLVKNALNAYRAVRKLSIWSAGISGADGLNLVKSADLTLMKKASPKTAEFINILKKEPNAKHYAYTEFNQTAHGANALKGTFQGGVQLLARHLEPQGYVRIWFDDLIEILEELNMSVKEEKKDKEEEKAKKAATKGKKEKKSDSCGSDSNSNSNSSKPKNPKKEEIKDEAVARRKMDEFFKKKAKIDTTGKKFCICLVSSAFKRRPVNGVEPDTPTFPASDTNLAAKMVQTLYNSKANVNGKLLHVILASGKFNESLDLQGVQHLHYLSPFMSRAAEAQATGRARRNCSHVALGLNADWKVTIYRYISTLPPGVSYGPTKKAGTKGQGSTTAVPGISFYPRGTNTIDHVVQVAQKRSHNQLEILYEVVKRRAVDCALFSTFHSQGKGVKCNKLDDVLADVKAREPPPLPLPVPVNPVSNRPVNKPANTQTNTGGNSKKATNHVKPTNARTNNTNRPKNTSSTNTTSTNTTSTNTSSTNTTSTNTSSTQVTNNKRLENNRARQIRQQRQEHVEKLKHDIKQLVQRRAALMEKRKTANPQSRPANRPTNRPPNRPANRPRLPQGTQQSQGTQKPQGPVYSKLPGHSQGTQMRTLPRPPSDRPVGIAQVPRPPSIIPSAQGNNNRTKRRPPQFLGHSASIRRNSYNVQSSKVHVLPQRDPRPVMPMPPRQPAVPGIKDRLMDTKEKVAGKIKGLFRRA